MADLRSLLTDGRVHVLDGAMGTMLYDRGVFVNVCYDELNATHPALVEEVHTEYVRAGAEIIETNTFGANPVKLSSFRLEERTEELNRLAAEIAVRAANGRAAVAGAIGPLGIRIEPLGPTSREEARDYFGRQVDGLLEGGVGGFILETFCRSGRTGAGVPRGARPVRPAGDRARHGGRRLQDHDGRLGSAGGAGGRGVGRGRGGPQLLGRAPPWCWTAWSGWPKSPRCPSPPNPTRACRARSATARCTSPGRTTRRGTRDP